MQYRRAFTPGGSYFFTLALKTENKICWCAILAACVRRLLKSGRGILLKLPPCVYCPTTCTCWSNYPNTIKTTQCACA